MMRAVLPRLGLLAALNALAAPPMIDARARLFDRFPPRP